MRLRIGNLVRHKSGGPIMMITREPPASGFVLPIYECAWVEDRKKLFADYNAALLQAVYADGSPRDYGNENQNETN